MNKMILDVVQLIIVIAIIYGIVRYWNNRLSTKYMISAENKSYKLFLTGQVSSVLVTVFYSVDPQNNVYLKRYSLLGNGAMEFWSVIGVEIVAFILMLIVANLVGHLLYALSKQGDKSLYEQILNDDWSASILFSMMVVTISAIGSNFVLRPFLLDWISSNSGFIPLY